MLRRFTDTDAIDQSDLREFLELLGAATQGFWHIDRHMYLDHSMASGGGEIMSSMWVSEFKSSSCVLSERLHVLALISH